MEHAITTKDIIINLSIQLIQIIIFFWIFVHFFGQKIAEKVVERKKKEEKLAQADHEYQKIIDDAKSHAHQIIKDATVTKNNLTSQGQQAAEQAKIKIIEQAHHEAKLIIQKGEQELNIQKKILEQEFAESVKKTALTAVQKVIQTNDSAQRAYVEGLVQEYTQSTTSQSNHEHQT